MRNILLVEDNLDEVDLTLATFRRTEQEVSMHHVSDGRECMEFLRKNGKYSDAPTPDLVLLDIWMPDIDGISLLKSVRGPAVVMLTARASADLARRALDYLVGPDKPRPEACRPRAGSAWPRSQRIW